MATLDQHQEDLKTMEGEATGTEEPVVAKTTDLDNCDSDTDSGSFICLDLEENTHVEKGIQDKGDRHDVSDMEDNEVSEEETDKENNMDTIEDAMKNHDGNNCESTSAVFLFVKEVYYDDHDLTCYFKLISPEGAASTQDDIIGLYNISTKKYASLNLLPSSDSWEGQTVFQLPPLNIVDDCHYEVSSKNITYVINEGIYRYHLSLHIIQYCFTITKTQYF